MINKYSDQQPYNVNRNPNDHSRQQADQNRSQYTYLSSLQWKPPPPPLKWSESQPPSSLSQNYSQQPYPEKLHNKHDNFYTQSLSHETSVDKETLEEIKRKSDLYEAAKEQVTTRIKNDFEGVIDKIREAENKVLEDVGKELGENPFSTLLARIYSGKNITDAEIKNILSKKIPQDFGPSKEMFQNLYKEIEAFNSHLRKKDDKLTNITILSECTWKECPHNIKEKRKYSIDENNADIATKMNNNDHCCTVVGNVSLPLNKVIGWNVKIIKSFYNGGSILIGIAPSDINQDSDDSLSNGWFLHCGDLTLYSGPPHNYKERKYGSEDNVKTDDIVGVVMDTASGELSFIVDGVNYGASYTGIPLDKPLSPCVLLYYGGDSVELDLSKVKENVDSSVLIPSEIKVKSITWDSLTFTWDKIDGASFYQVEVDGNILCNVLTQTNFTKSNLHPDSEHSFRIRAVKGNSVSEWSDFVKGKTQKMAFETSGWKECPDDVDECMKYLIEENNPKIATKDGDGYGNGCTIIGNTSLLPNKVTSWSIKIINSGNNNGECIFVGVAPFDINQNEDNECKCGWYLHCYDLRLRSGPPHNHICPMAAGCNYVHTGDSIGVIMDTAKDELSFILNEVNLGVAYEGIPLDKPLVPCVILKYGGDSVELDTTEVKENVNRSIPVPSKLKVKNVTWDSITLSWKEDKSASFYQVEMDGNTLRDITATNSFTKWRLLEGSEHTFRVRTARRNSVSEWSDAVKGRTAEKPWDCIWKKCPSYVFETIKYFVDVNNPRIVTKINDGYYNTMVGNTSLPPNKVTSWNIKVLKSKKKKK